MPRAPEPRRRRQALDWPRARARPILAVSVAFPQKYGERDSVHCGAAGGCGAMQADAVQWLHGVMQADMGGVAACAPVVQLGATSPTNEASVSGEGRDLSGLAPIVSTPPAPAFARSWTRWALGSRMSTGGGRSFAACLRRAGDATPCRGSRW